MEEANEEEFDPTIEKFETYEKYLESFITEVDRYYLENEELARALVEFGYHSKGDILSKEQFIKQKEEIQIAREAKQNNQKQQLASANKNFDGFPFLQALAEREQDVRNGKLATIIFIRDEQQKNGKKYEISGYIDYGHRLKTENFELYFNRQKKLLPKKTDLSYYNWESQISNSVESPNFRVDANSELGLQFKNKRDRKIINVNPKGNFGDNTRRIVIETKGQYTQVVLYDHQTRKKN